MMRSSIPNRLSLKPSAFVFFVVLLNVGLLRPAFGTAMYSATGEFTFTILDIVNLDTPGDLSEMFRDVDLDARVSELTTTGLGSATGIATVDSPGHVPMPGDVYSASLAVEGKSRGIGSSSTEAEAIGFFAFQAPFIDRIQVTVAIDATLEATASVIYPTSEFAEVSLDFFIECKEELTACEGVNLITLRPDLGSTSHAAISYIETFILDNQAPGIEDAEVLIPELRMRGVATSVPESSTLSLLGIGLAGLGFSWRRLR